MLRAIRHSAGPSILESQVPPGLLDVLIGQVTQNLPTDGTAGELVQAARSPVFQTFLDMAANMLGGTVEFEDPNAPTGVSRVTGVPLGRLADSLAARIDAGAARGMMGPARQAWQAERDAIIRGMHPDWTDEQLARLGEDRFSLEKLAANLLMYKRTRAIDTGENWSKSQGLTDDRRGRGYGQLLSAMYREASNLGDKSPWNTMGGADENMRAMIAIAEARGFSKVLNRKGMFDASGSLTPEGEMAVKSALDSAGHGLRAVRDLTGAKTATEALKAIGNSDFLGPGIMSQITDPNVGRKLREFNHMAKVSGIPPQGRLGLLKRLSDFSGGGDLRPALNYGTQLMSMSALSEDPMRGAAGDPAKHQQLGVWAIARAQRDPRQLFASAAAAALTPQYGKEMAWDIADDLIRKSRNTRHMVLGLQQWMPGIRLNDMTVRNLMANPNAKEYLASGRSTGFAVRNAINPMIGFVAANSKFLRAHGDRILRDKGTLSMANIATWMEENGATPEQIGGVQRHLAQFGPNIASRMRFPGGLSTDDVLGFLSTGMDVQGRNRVIVSARDRARMHETYGHYHDKRGLEGAADYLATQDGGIPGAVGAAFTGSDSAVPAPSPVKMPENPVAPVGAGANMFPPKTSR